MMIIEKEFEIIALNKLLNFIKFDCTDPDCLLFAASPFINDIYSNIQKEIRDIYSKKGYVYENAQNFIEQNTLYIEHIKGNIKRTRNWNDLSAENKRGYLLDLIQPYCVTDKTLDELLGEGDVYHQTNSQLSH